MPKGSREFGGRKFHFLRASDIHRDGMGFEAWEGDVHVAEVFYWDKDGKATFSCFVDDLPVDLVAFLVGDGLGQITPVK